MSKVGIINFNEIVGAYLIPTLSNDDLASLEANPAGFLKSNCEVEFDGDIQVLKNNADEIHLALPYYDFVDKLSAASLSEGDLTAVAGGEILITLCVLGGLGVGAAIAGAAGVGAGLTATAITIGCGIAGGVIGATVVATSVTAGVRASKGKNIDGSKK